MTIVYRPAPRVLSLGEGFYVPVTPARFPKLTLRFRNDRAAATVGLDGLTEAQWEGHFARFEPLDGNLPRPLALRYHGHQFGVYNPQLGDGRGFLFAQLLDARGRLLDLGTKGSGQTPFSRSADGRLTLKGGVREVLATEMLEALGVNTSRSFSLFETGESLVRHDEPSPTRASVLVRLSHSHLRFGSFQCLAWSEDTARVRELLEFAVEQHFPTLAGEGDLPAAFVREVTRRIARTCAQWMAAGFVHGVLNTDNMNVTGESFDYGPWRFLPRFDATFVAAYFDGTGLYAFGRQPRAVLWNLQRLAEALAGVGNERTLLSATEGFEEHFNSALRVEMLARLGLQSRGHDPDTALIDACLTFLQGSPVGYDRFFFDWWSGAASERRALAGRDGGRYWGGAFLAFRRALDGYEAVDATTLESPYFQGDAPCSMQIDEVEAIWSTIAARDDWSAFNAKVAAMRAMGATLTRGRS